jgi:hypothetical protein
VTEKLIIPLLNFDKEQSGTLDLGDSKIIPINETSVQIHDSELKLKYCLETNRRSGEEPRRTLDRVLIVFKLFKDDVILSNCVYVGSNHVDYLPHYTHWKDEKRGMPVYKLSGGEEQDFIKFWNTHIEISPSNFAASRFHLADYQPYSDQRFVSYIESLEFLLVPDSGEGEISYKFRSRGTIIFGLNKSLSERKEILDTLKDAYSLRSAVVHGNNDKRDKLLGGKVWEEKLRPVRCLTRDGIKFFFDKGCLDNYERRKELIEEITIFNLNVEGIPD